MNPLSAWMYRVHKTPAERLVSKKLRAASAERVRYGISQNRNCAQVYNTYAPMTKYMGTQFDACCIRGAIRDPGVAWSGNWLNTSPAGAA